MLLSLLLAAGMLLPARGLAAQSPGPEHPEVVSAATSERSVRADLATVTLRFSREGRTPADAGRQLANKADSVRRALAALGIPRDSVISGSRWYWWDNRIQVFERPGRAAMVPDTGYDGRVSGAHRVVYPDTFYRASELLQVRIRDLSSVGQVIDAALAQGITEISELQFSATNTEAAQREAIREATERARARAEIIAAAGGGRLGRTLRLSTEGGESTRSVPYDQLWLTGVTATGGAASRTGETVVVAPTLKVSAKVDGRWEFVEGR